MRLKRKSTHKKSLHSNVLTLCLGALITFSGASLTGSSYALFYDVHKSSVEFTAAKIFPDTAEEIVDESNRKVKAVLHSKKNIEKTLQNYTRSNESYKSLSQKIDQAEGFLGQMQGTPSKDFGILRDYLMELEEELSESEKEKSEVYNYIFNAYNTISADSERINKAIIDSKALIEAARYHLLSIDRKERSPSGNNITNDEKDKIIPASDIEKDKEIEDRKESNEESGFKVKEKSVTELSGEEKVMDDPKGETTKLTNEKPQPDQAKEFQENVYINEKGSEPIEKSHEDNKQ